MKEVAFQHTGPLANVVFGVCDALQYAILPLLAVLLSCTIDERLRHSPNVGYVMAGWITRVVLCARDDCPDTGGRTRPFVFKSQLQLQRGILTENQV